MSQSYGLVYPFLVCKSQGGPYDDEAFVAGVQLGRIDEALRHAAQIPAALVGLTGGNTVSFTCYTSLRPQLDLVGMSHGYPTVTVIAVGPSDDHAPPQWCRVTFTRGG